MVLPLIGAAVGVASAGFGLWNMFEGNEQSEEGREMQRIGALQQAAAAGARANIYREQADRSVGFAERNRDLELKAAQQSLAASTKSQEINRSIIASERANEAQRMQAMELDARRKSLEIIRNQQRARSLAITNATAQGASMGSGLQGGYGQISGQSGVNLLGVQQNLDIGRNIFANNLNISNQRVAMSDLETLYAQQRAAMTTARSQMAYQYAVSNAVTQKALAGVDELMSEGQAKISEGGGMVSAGQSQSAMGMQFIQAGASMFNMGMNAGNVFGTGTGLSMFGGGGTSGFSNNIPGIYSFGYANQ